MLLNQISSLSIGIISVELIIDACDGFSIPFGAYDLSNIAYCTAWDMAFFLIDLGAIHRKKSSKSQP